MRKVLSIFFALFVGLTVSAQIIDKPNPPRLVVDEPDVLNSTEESQLETKLVKYNDSTSTQIQIVIVESLNGLEPVDYAQQIGEGWGVGQKDKNNGVVILVSTGDRKMWIHTGRGVEAELTDAFCSDVVNDIMKPAFKQKQFYQGLDDATTAIIQKLNGTYKNDKKNIGWISPIFIFIAIIIAIILLSIFGRKGGGGGSDGGGWIANAILWSALNSNRGGSSGGWGGGGSSGGFGGWGGGSFGGGGAGGSW